MAERIAFELNGETQSVEVAPDTPLLYVLRNELGLSNPHFGCGLAQCGACTVLVDGAPARSCSLPVSAAAGTKVTTLAGLGTSEKPHPLQRSGVLDPPAARALLDRHLSGAVDLRKPLWTLASFLLWQRRWESRPREVAAGIAQGL